MKKQRGQKLPEEVKLDWLKRNPWCWGRLKKHYSPRDPTIIKMGKSLKDEGLYNQSSGNVDIFVAMKNFFKRNEIQLKGESGSPL